MQHNKGSRRIAPNKRPWLERHTIKITNGCCWSWWGDNKTQMTNQELAYHWMVEPLEPEFTIKMNKHCRGKCVNPEHMTKVYRDLEKRRPGHSQSAETVLRIRDHEGDFHEIARLFGASWQTVFNIKNGRSHRAITGLPFIDVKAAKRTSPKREDEG